MTNVASLSSSCGSDEIRNGFSGQAAAQAESGPSPTSTGEKKSEAPKKSVRMKTSVASSRRSAVCRSRPVEKARQRYRLMAINGAVPSVPRLKMTGTSDPCHEIGHDM